MTDEELEDAKRRGRYARASLAKEGMHPTPKIEAMFEMFDPERMPHVRRRRHVAEWARAYAEGTKLPR